MRARPAGVAASACFVGSAAAAVGFVVAYLLRAGPQWLGLLLGLACAGLALGLILWAAHLLPERTYVEGRPPLPSPEESRAAVVDTLARGSQESPGILRRTLVLATVTLGAAVVVPLRSLLLPGSRPPDVALARTPWRRGVRVVTGEGDLVRARDLAVGTFLTVFPETAPEADDATAVLVCLDRRDLVRRAPQDLEGAPSAVVAFSKLCTHAGCPVGLYQQETRQLFCPCHQAVFDVLDGARPVAGPAARPLPSLPLVVDDEGYVAAAGDFDGQVGPTYWRSS